MIGIIGAMQIEVEKLIEAMEGTCREEYGGILFSIGKISGTACVIAQCGVGKVFAAVCAQTMILRYQPDCIINVGVAGGIGEGVQIGDLVVATGFVPVSYTHLLLKKPEAPVKLEFDYMAVEITRERGIRT